MTNPNDRRRIAAAHRNRFNAQYDEYVATLDPDHYDVDVFIDGFLTYFGRPVRYETVEEIRDELHERALITDGEVITGEPEEE